MLLVFVGSGPRHEVPDPAKVPAQKASPRGICTRSSVQKTR